MDLMEITEKERLSREDAAARLHALADALARNNEVEFDRGGLRFKVHVPDEVDFKLEIEIERRRARARGRTQMVTNRCLSAAELWGRCCIVRWRHDDQLACTAASRGTARGPACARVVSACGWKPAAPP